MPYYYVLDPSSDVTIAPIFTQNAGTVLAGEYRRLHRDGYTQLAGAGTYTEYATRATVDSEQGKDFRGYFRGFGGYGVERSLAGRLRRLSEPATTPSSTATRSTTPTCCAAAPTSRASRTATSGR